jgi:hypothetical protein
VVISIDLNHNNIMQNKEKIGIKIYKKKTNTIINSIIYSTIVTMIHIMTLMMKSKIRISAFKVNYL